MLEHRGLVLALAFALLGAGLAGCLGDEDEGGPPADDDGDASGPTDGDGSSGDDGDDGSQTEQGDNEDENGTTEPVGEPVQTTMHFTADNGLSVQPPQNGSIAIAGSASALAMSEIEVTRFLSEPVTEPLLVQNQDVQLDLWVQTDTPKLAGSDFDLVIWGGTTLSTTLIMGTTIGQGAIEPGQPTQVEVTLPFDGARGLIVPTGESLEIFMATSQNNEVDQGLQLLTGGEMASTATITFSSLAEDPTADIGGTTSDTLSGTIPLNAQFVNCDVEEGVTTELHTLQVNATSYLELAMTASSSAPRGSDLDMTLEQGGEAIVSTSSPWAEETILLAGPTLEGLSGQELTVRVTACQAAGTSYEIQIQQA